MKNDFQDTGMRQHRITVSGRWETREVLGLLQFPPCESSQAMVKAGTCRWSMPPWVQEIELRIQWGQREMAGRAAYNTREERDALRESLEDLQRVHLESSAEYWSLHPYEKIVNTREKNHPKALEEQWLFPIGRLENVIQRILDTVLRMILPQKWAKN